MPAKRQIGRKESEQAAMELLREDGWEQISVRQTADEHLLRVAGYMAVFLAAAVICRAKLR